MLDQKQVDKIKGAGRKIIKAPKSGDADLGALKHLPGTWKSLPGRGWNMIALPFEAGPFKYRLLLNQYNEDLIFTIVDKGVPNRGIALNGNPNDTDQFIVTLDYQQTIKQIAADDSPRSGEAGPPGRDIHHEPGLFLHMTNKATNNLDVARLATIPHGDSVLALGRWKELDGPPIIPDISGLPIGVPPDLKSRYLAPYKHFNDKPFEHLFNPVEPNALLEAANNGVNIVKTTELEFDSTHETGGIVNIPFVVRQANAAEMKSTFWIEELADDGQSKGPKLRLQYSQIVMLDFFPRRDGLPGLIRWPHVSINTLEKVVSKKKGK